MRQIIKQSLILVSQIVMSPFIIICKIEEWLTNGSSESFFGFCTHIVALLPGLPGAFLRKAFYSLTLEYCSTDCHIGFGTIFAHRSAIVGKHAYFGMYTIIGSAKIGDYSLVGSRSSIISRKALHTLGEDGRWTAFAINAVERTEIGSNVWIGEGCTVAANIGDGSQVGSGSVVSTDIKGGILVTGNPPRFIRHLDASGNNK